MTEDRLKRRIKGFLLVVGLIWLAEAPLGAQTTLVEYDAPAGTTIADNQAWTPVLMVNGTPIVGTVPTCTGTSAIVCTFPLPDISKAVTASGPQTFRIVLRDPVLGDGPAGAPLSRTRPGGVSLRFKSNGQRVGG